MTGENPLEIKERNYGFVIPEIKPEDYLFGSGEIDAQVLQEDGQWDEYLPIFEPQAKKTETSNCTGFATLNSLEILMRRKFGLEFNYSDRALGILAGTRPPGNDPNKVCEALRNNGAILESDLPFSDGIDSVEKYYSPDPLPKNLIQYGLDWLESYSYKHDWVGTGKPIPNEILKEALKFSPLNVGVYAWAMKDDLYVRVGGDTHWVVVYGYEDGKYWKCFDTYENDLKKLDWNFNFYFAKRISINYQQATPQNTAPLWTIWANIVKLAKLLFPGLETLEEQMQPTPQTPPVAPILPPQPPEPIRYMWTSPQEARHSFRVICDESGLRFQDKNLLCQVLWAESGFDIKRVNVNKNGTRDLGLIQANDYWYIKKGKLLTEDQALNDPEFCSRLFIKRFKQGFLTDWSAFKNKSYLKFTP